MKQLTVLSGKGGTGKTSITAAFASIAKNAVLCDNDVDAADLHLILHPEIKDEHIYEGAWIAQINQEQCNSCGICYDHCRFDAISKKEESSYYINELKCEGCKLCARVCPENAIITTQSLNNKWFISDTRLGKMVHARMRPGEENSGKLVALIKKEATKLANETNTEIIINDGPPGIGCSAISSISGSELIVLVIEPSLSGFHDAKRLIELVKSFDIKMLAIINKSDLNLIVTMDIENYLHQEKIDLIAKLPFDEEMIHSLLKGQTVIEYNADLEISQSIIVAWEQITNTINKIS